MIDPITIGLAFAAAQKAVEGIKKAIALGKDIKSLHGQFAQFFEHSDTVHKANITSQISNGVLTDGQIRAKSLELAMQAKALHDSEKELKDLLFWSGNADVWNHMMTERVRMFKERAEAERKKEDERAEARNKLLERIMIFLSFAALCVPAFFIGLYTLTHK